MRERVTAGFGVVHSLCLGRFQEHPGSEQLEQVVREADEAPLVTGRTRPRKLNWRKPRLPLIWPNTGSATALRRR